MLLLLLGFLFLLELARRRRTWTRLAGHVRVILGVGVSIVSGLERDVKAR